MELSPIILTPLLGAAILGFFSFITPKRFCARVSGTIATVAMFASFIFSIKTYYLSSSYPIDETLFNWIDLPSLHLHFSLRLDSLSALYCLFITGVGTLIHLYSIGYMKNDETPSRYFAYLNLFCFMMLVLVLGSSLPVLFLGWEGVGLCSYLLIGYWYSDIQKISAGRKAFIMNRIGDVGFLLGSFLVFKVFGTFDLAQIQATAAQNGGLISEKTFTIIGLLFFLACTGKSAQFPLFTWLPDAMAGPTPVSALIHAATMVTSGIYLLARISNILISAPIALNVIAVTGLFTAILSATAATAQSDIKKVLAYSTISQLGLMFLACGVAAFDAAVFHVLTHAFFKALLFLGAGSVIHALHEEQNIFKMGGLRKRLPITFATFAVGAAALSAVPPIGGFFSKDEIMWKTLSSPYGGWTLWIGGMAVSFLTAFYVARLFVLVFLSPSRVEEKLKSKIHESPVVMTIPLISLGILSVCGGFLGIPHLSWIQKWLHMSEIESHTPVYLEYVSMSSSVAVVALGLFLGYKKYAGTKTEEVSSRFLMNAWSFDSFYQREGVQSILSIASGIKRWVDEAIVDRVIGTVTSVLDLSGNALRLIASGSMQMYLVFTLIAFALSIGAFWYGWIH